MELQIPDSFDAEAIQGISRRYLEAQFESEYWRCRRRKIVARLMSDSGCPRHEAQAETDKLKQLHWDSWLSGVVWLASRNSEIIRVAKGRDCEPR